jgi:hypothetical protein
MKRPGDHGGVCYRDPAPSRTHALVWRPGYPRAERRSGHSPARSAPYGLGARPRRSVSPTVVVRRREARCGTGRRTGAAGRAERKNVWGLAEDAGHAAPYTFQHLLLRAKWDEDAVGECQRSCRERLVQVVSRNEGSAKCSRMARTPLGAVRYANTRCLPPQQAQAKTSKVVFP